MAKLTDDERKLVLETQQAFGDAKKAMRIIQRNMRALSAINRGANRMGAANAAGWVQGAVGACHGELIKAHMTGSDALCEHWDDGAGIARGGGGGR